MKKQIIAIIILLVVIIALLLYIVNQIAQVQRLFSDSGSSIAERLDIVSSKLNMLRHDLGLSPDAVPSEP